MSGWSSPSRSRGMRVPPARAARSSRRWRVASFAAGRLRAGSRDLCGSAAAACRRSCHRSCHSLPQELRQPAAAAWSAAAGDHAAAAHSVGPSVLWGGAGLRRSRLLGQCRR